MFDINQERSDVPQVVEAEISVLLLEDEVYYGKLIQRTLRTPDPRFKVTWVTNLAMALELITENSFDVVISDLELPDATQLDALIAIRASNAEVPIVILTAHSEASIGLQAIRSGADDFIIKERVSADSLVRSIRYAAERKKCEELRTRLNAIDNFTEILAHELRAPLIGSSRVLECLEDPKVSAQDKVELTHQLRESNKRLVNLVTQLIEVAQGRKQPVFNHRGKHHT
jgi:DNA-binding NtrC family response regulator